MFHFLLKIQPRSRFRVSSPPARHQLGIEGLEDRLLLAVFPVTTVADSGPGSLRQAILDANANPGPNDIVFAITGPLRTIRPFSALPTATSPVTIDGTTQPDFQGTPVVEINGSVAGFGVNGLDLAGGNSTVEGLVINGFAAAGIRLERNGGDLVAGNYIGTDITGAAAVANGGAGIQIWYDAPGNTIGGMAPGASNVISGNQGDGISIAGLFGGAGSVVQGNYIGTQVNGAAALGNGAYGVEIESQNGNLIGGTDPGAGNLISGNSLDGLYLQSTDRNVVQGNLIGTDVTGTMALGNHWDGIYLNGSSNNTIGGTDPGAGNLVSGNIQLGVSMDYGSGNLFQGNLIGTDGTGTAGLGNFAGMDIGDSSNNTIGGTVPGAGNLISANQYTGIRMTGDIGSRGSLVQGNWIGTDISGTAVLANGGDGIDLEEIADITIGGTDPGAGNLISGNRLNGVYVIDNNVQHEQSDLIQGNLIGTDASGTVALGNAADGVLIGGDAQHTTVGGSAPGAGNLISGNAIGVEINSYPFSSATANLVQGNLIGTQADGVSPLGNHSHGVFITRSASINTVIGNTIAFNGGYGVGVDTGTRNAIQSNVITANADLGIKLLNHGNHDLEYPVLTSAQSDGDSMTIAGTLTSLPAVTFTLEFFGNGACDPSGYGQGEIILGQAPVTTDNDGYASFTVTLPVGIPAGYFVSGTTTDPGNSTSEFSQCQVVEEGGTANPPGKMTNFARNGINAAMLSASAKGF